MMNKPVLKIKRLTAAYDEYTVLRGIDLTLEKGQIVCIVGESGSGKTSLIRAVTGYEGLHIADGTIEVEGDDVTHISARERRNLLGRTIGYIPQNPAGSYNPIRQYEPQIGEMLASHTISYRKFRKELPIEGRFIARIFEYPVRETKWSGSDIKEYSRWDVEHAFERMGLENADRLLKSRPYELSGGMNQRIAIAAAMLLEPSVLLCDEPTSALDVATANLVTNEFLGVCRERGTSILMVTHNIALASIIADKIAIMHEGEIVECGDAEQIIRNPQNEYTKRLLGDVPRLTQLRKEKRCL